MTKGKTLIENMKEARASRTYLYAQDLNTL